MGLNCSAKSLAYWKVGSISGIGSTDAEKVIGPAPLRYWKVAEILTSEVLPTTQLVAKLLENELEALLQWALPAVAPKHANSPARLPVAKIPAIAYSPDHLPTPLARVEAFLEEARRGLNAHSCVSYISDPYWPIEMRLIAMPGVQSKEPMYGFVSPEGTKAVLLRGDAESFCSDAIGADERRDSMVRVPGTIARELRHLFGDFVEREGIKWSARLLRKTR